MKRLLKKCLGLMSAPRYVLATPSLNKMGLQVWRINSKLKELQTPIDKKQPSAVIDAVEKLERDGICLIPNFLSVSECEQLETEIAIFKESAALKRESGKEGGEIKWEHGNFPSQGFALVNMSFRNNKTLHAIIEGYTKRKVAFAPEVIYQKLTVPEGFVDKDDIQTVLHADRFYRTIKIFYTVSDHTEQNGAFWYSPRSQVMNAERIGFEKEYSYRSALEKVGRKHIIDKNFFESGRSVIHPRFKEKFPPQQMCTPKNTLMIVDVSGFHKRGLISPGCTRETIRMIYHYVHAPLWAQALLNMFKRAPARYLN